MKGKTKKRTSRMQRMRLIALSLVLVLIFSGAHSIPVMASGSVDTEETKNNSGNGYGDLNGKDKEAKYVAIIHTYNYVIAANGNLSSMEYVYKYTSETCPLLVGYERGTSYGLYLKSIGSTYANFYTMDISKSNVIRPTVTLVESYNYCSDGSVVYTEYDYQTTLQTYQVKNLASSGSSFHIEGDYEIFAYSNAICDIGTGELRSNPSVEEVADYYYNVGNFNHVNGWRAFLCDLTSRSIFDDVQPSVKVSHSLIEPILEDGAFIHSGVSNSLGEYNKSGIRVSFGYNNAISGGSNAATLYYYYWLPLEAAEYSLNLADYQKIILEDGSTYALTSISFQPVMKCSVYAIMYAGPVVRYTAEQLEDAGCFETGGDPISWLGSNSSDDIHGAHGDPSLEDTYVKPDSIQTPNELEWDESEHSFWENVLHFLENIANNIAAAGTAIISLPNLLKDMLEDFFNKMYEYYFVPDEVLYKARIDSLNARFGFVDDIKAVANYITGVFDISNGKVPPKYTIPISCEAWNMDTEVVIDFSWYKPFKPMFDILIAGFCWLTFAYNIWRKLPEIISGAGMDISYISREVSRSDLEIPEADIVSYKLPTFEWYFK